MKKAIRTRASARALVCAALTGSALGAAMLAAVQVGSADGDSPRPNITEAGLRGPIQTAPGRSPGVRLIKASLLPEPPAILPSTPIPYTAFRAPRRDTINASERDLECLTRAVYFESRGDSDAGLFAVAQVVVNRSRHPSFPKSICGVVNQGVERRSCQFSFACKPTRVSEPREWRRARDVAERALAGETLDEVGTSTFFHAARINPRWRNLTRVGRIGNHVFYRYAGKRGAASAFSGDVKPSLLDSFTRPLQAALSKPAVQTATEVPEPLLALPAAPVKLAAPILKPAVPVLVPAAPAVQPDAAPVAPTTVEPASPLLQSTSSPTGAPTPAASTNL